MPENLPFEELILFLAKIRNDGSGLSNEEAKRFLQLLSDPGLGVRQRVESHVWRRANMLAPFVRRQLEAGKPPKT